MAIAPSIIDPALFKVSIRRQNLNVFLCGPGLGSEGFALRSYIKDVLHKNCARIELGEDLVSKKFKHTKRVDLQTLEAQFAHLVDFTILLLESPGAIAELGTFSMIENIRARLFVVVPTRFFGSESYIARGPLSLISSFSANNIIYYDPSNLAEIERALKFPVALYKFVKSTEGYRYAQNAIRQFTSTRFSEDAYAKYFEPHRAKFLEAVTLAAITTLRTPTFAELVRWLALEPDKVSSSISKLFRGHKIDKIAGGAYKARNGYADSLLKPFSTSELSKLRAMILAHA